MSGKRLFDLLAANPARLLGVQAGTLAAGMEADIAVIDPERPWIVDAGKMAASAKKWLDEKEFEEWISAKFAGTGARCSARRSGASSRRW